LYFLKISKYVTSTFSFLHSFEKEFIILLFLFEKKVNLIVTPLCKESLFQQLNVFEGVISKQQSKKP